MLKHPLLWIVALLLVLAAGMGIYAVQNRDMTSKASERRSSETEYAHARRKVAEIPAALKDVDGDGLKDWEEALWKTDPNNPDTDGDGTQDGDEVKEDRNPLKMGPDDRLTVSSIIQNQYIPSEMPAQKPRIRPSTTPPPISAQNRAVMQGTPARESPEKASMRAYGNELAKKIKATIDWEGEVAAFEYFLDEKSESETGKAKLYAIADLYKSRAASISSMSPPSAFATVHATLTERTSLQSSAVKKLAAYGNFNTVPKNEWEAYGAAITASGKALYEVALLFREKRVTFASGEDGSIFTLPDGNPQ